MKRLTRISTWARPLGWLGLLVACSLATASHPAGVARADNGTGGTGGTNLTADDFEYRWEEPEGATDWKPITNTELPFYFNRARCLCNTRVRLRIDLKAASKSKVSTRTTQPGSLRAFVGTNCATEEVTRTKVCQLVASTSQVFDLANGPLYASMSARTLFAPIDSEGGADGGVAGPQTEAACESSLMSQSVTLFLDMNGDNLPDLAGSSAPNTSVTLDTDPPPVPRISAVLGGNEALEVRWTSLGNLSDLQGYIVFCARDGDKVVFPGAFNPDYSSPARLCPRTVIASSSLQDADAGAQLDAAVMGGTGGAADAGSGGSGAGTGGTAGSGGAGGSGGAAGESGGGSGPTNGGERVPATLPFRNVDPAYACSDLLTGGETERRIYRLQNQIPYLVGVASVDKQGNASPITEVVLQRPFPTRDFYRSYRAAGGAEVGGFCSMGSQVRGWDAAWLAFGGVLFVLGLRGWRRRR